MTKHTCTHCHQTLRPVHPLEIKRAVQLLVALARNPKKEETANLCTTGNSLMFGTIAALARTEAARRIEPDTDKWSRSWTSEEYNLAAQILSDGWMPVGYILDKERDCCNCPSEKDEYVPDPAGKVSQGTFNMETQEHTWVKCRRVVIKIPRLHTELFCTLSKEPF